MIDYAACHLCLGRFVLFGEGDDLGDLSIRQLEVETSKASWSSIQVVVPFVLTKTSSTR